MRGSISREPRRLGSARATGAPIAASSHRGLPSDEPDHRLLAPDDIEWVRAAAGSPVLDQDLATAAVVVVTADRAAARPGVL
jgi:hypothetical protein